MTIDYSKYLKNRPLCIDDFHFSMARARSLLLFDCFQLAVILVNYVLNNNKGAMANRRIFHKLDASTNMYINELMCCNDLHREKIENCEIIFNTSYKMSDGANI